jgi:S1-C subfamily serine protease
LKEYVPHTAHLAVVFRQKDGEGGSGEWFDVIEKDDELDVALCQIRHFADIKKMGFFELGAVDLSTRALAVGRSVFIAGFPLGWWNASIQAGHIAAEHTILPPGGMFDLFQVGVAGNQGDSGGPVIDLETGEVVGIVVRGSFNVGSEEQAITVQSSGLMYAVPVSKLSGLLSKHKIQIETPRSVVRPGDTRHQRKSN